jgi:hypothetical protein
MGRGSMGMGVGNMGKGEMGKVEGMEKWVVGWRNLSL